MIICQKRAAKDTARLGRSEAVIETGMGSLLIVLDAITDGWRSRWLDQPLERLVVCRGLAIRAEQCGGNADLS